MRCNKTTQVRRSHRHTLHSKLYADNEPFWKNYLIFQRQAYQQRSSSISIPQQILNPGSTTKRMRRVSSTFVVDVLSHTWGKPRLSERLALALPARQQALIREVNLFCDDHLWIFGRVVIPFQTLSGKGHLLKQLGINPLGQVLFQDPHLQRSEFEIALVKPENNYFPAINDYIVDPVESLWARRSQFYFYGKPLLLTEVFTAYSL